MDQNKKSTQIDPPPPNPITHKFTDRPGGVFLAVEPQWHSCNIISACAKTLRVIKMASLANFIQCELVFTACEQQWPLNIYTDTCRIIGTKSLFKVPICVYSDTLNNWIENTEFIYYRSNLSAVANIECSNHDNSYVSSRSDLKRLQFWWWKILEAFISKF